MEIMETSVQKIGRLLLSHKFLSLFAYENPIPQEEQNFWHELSKIAVTGYGYEKFTPTLDKTKDGKLVLMWQEEAICSRDSENTGIIACPINPFYIYFSKIDVYNMKTHTFDAKVGIDSLADYPEEIRNDIQKKVEHLKRIFQDATHQSVRFD